MFFRKARNKFEPLILLCMANKPMLRAVFVPLTIFWLRE